MIQEELPFDKATMYGQEVHTSSRDPVNESIKVMPASQKTQMILIGKQRYEFPSTQYVELLESKIHDLERVISTMKNSMQSLSKNVNQLTESVGQTKRELSRKMDTLDESR